MSRPRVVALETLDQLDADDPLAQHSRRDLMRLHRAMGTRSILARGWQALLPAAPQVATPWRILELGAGDGTLLLGVAQQLHGAWPAVRPDAAGPAGTGQPSHPGRLCRAGLEGPRRSGRRA
jgi:hypothetical protein